MAEDSAGTRDEGRGDNVSCSCPAFEPHGKPFDGPATAAVACSARSSLSSYLPISLSSSSAQVIVYLMGLLWSFLAVGIIADIFMEAIEVGLPASQRPYPHPYPYPYALAHRRSRQHRHTSSRLNIVTLRSHASSLPAPGNHVAGAQAPPARWCGRQAQGVERHGRQLDPHGPRLVCPGDPPLGKPSAQHAAPSAARVSCFDS